MSTHDDSRDTIWELIKDARVAMLTSHDDGRLRSRPMVACQADFDDGCLWFFTHADSPKAAQVEREHEVNVSYANATEHSYVSMSGTANVLRDRAAIDAHWTVLMKAWFPAGKDDPQLVMLKVEVSQAEYWDAPSSRMVLAFDYLKARLTGHPPEMGAHHKVDLRQAPPAGPPR